MFGSNPTRAVVNNPIGMFESANNLNQTSNLSGNKLGSGMFGATSTSGMFGSNPKLVSPFASAFEA
jgi:hypothetical protein